VRRGVLGIALLLVIPAASLAQSSTLRVTREAVILEEPRGESRVLVTVPPGFVLDFLERQLDWYQVIVPWPESTRSRTTATGWINRAAVQPLPDSASRQQPAVQTGGRRDTSPADLPPSASRAQPPPSAPTSRQTMIGRGSTELILDGVFTGVRVDGESASSFQLDSAAGYFTTQALEVAVISSVQKATNVDTFGGLAGAVMYNVRMSHPINGFVGGSVGRTFGLSPSNATTVTVFGGARMMVPGGAGAVFVRPFWQNNFFPGSVRVTAYGVALGVSIFFTQAP
jgi:hypothetical protein